MPFGIILVLCGIDTSDMDETFEDYQAIYNKTVEMHGDKEGWKKRWWQRQSPLSHSTSVFFVLEKQN